MTAFTSYKDATEHDFPEEWHTENGMYQNQCQSCGEMFIGYKRRITCKVCLIKQQDISAEE